MKNVVNCAHGAKNKPSFKTTTLIAAIGMIVYALYIVVRYIIYYAYPTAYCFDLWIDIRTRLIFDSLPISLIIAGIGLYKKRPIDTMKSFLFLTVCLFIALIGTLVFSSIYTYYHSIWPPFCWRMILLVAGIVWLFMLRNQPLEDASPRSYQVTLAISMALLALPIVLEAISGIALLSGREIVLNLQSGTVKTWVKFIAPVLPLIHFVFPSIKEINLTRNSHCVPGSLAERTFRRNKTFAVVMVIISIVAFCLTIFCAKMLYVAYIRHNLYILNYENRSFLFRIMGIIGAFSFCVSAFIAWVMLSIMAFRQLPNPRGYKIYNTVCLCLILVSFILSVVLTRIDSPAQDLFVDIFITSFSAFYITTAIRAVSYSLHTC